MNQKRTQPLAVAIVATIGLCGSIVATAKAQGVGAPPMSGEVFHRSLEIEGVSIAYREAGNREQPTILLLHGYPSSSHMFRTLIPVLADRYHVIAPDYPGYGASDMPDRSEYEYSFANITRTMNLFLQRKGIESFAVYLMDYGAPVGFRLFAMDPERVSAFIIQNGNAYDEGIAHSSWDGTRALWADPSEERRQAIVDAGAFSLAATRWQYTHGTSNPERISPDNWHIDQYLLDRPGNHEIQLDMFVSYGSNVALYPDWQALFREHQPPALIVWGRNDQVFPEAGAHPYMRDLNQVEFHLYDTGHVALEEYGAAIAQEILDFMDREVRGDGRPF